MPSLQLHCKIDGSSNKTVLLLPGLLGTTRYYEGLTQQLNDKGFRVVRMDLLGFGKSPHPKDQAAYSLDNHAQAIYRTLQAQHITTIDVLVGNSISTLIAARLYRAHPQIFKRLLLIAPLLYANTQQAHTHMIDNNNLPNWLLAGKSAKLLCNTICHVRILGGAIAILSIRNIPVAVRWDTRLHGWPAYHGTMTAAINDHQAYEFVRATRQPVDLLAGTTDAITDTLTLQSLAQANSNVRLHTWHGGHHPALQAPQLIAEIIKNMVN